MYPEIKYDEQILLDRINSTTPTDLDRALNAEKASFGDFLSLLSPLAAGELPRMRERARKFRLSHFGRVARLYAPIYFSNFCVNNCVYCGFRHSNHFPRRRLSIEETLAEAAILKKWGLDNVLIIAGEDKQTCSMDYLVPLIRELKKEFSYVSIELAPMTEEEYRTLFEAGAHGVSLYQETYDRPLYAELHPSGPKRDYDNRIHAPALAARAGFYNVGVGALLGLHNWRSEAVSVAGHALSIKKHYWRTRNQFSFPRITPMEGGYQIPHPVTQDELEQMMLAFRIYFPESDIFISTRERHAFRMSLIQTCATHISAGSKVAPGAYVESEKTGDKDLGQFTVMDDHSVENVVRSLRAINMEPVFKDWDPILGV